MLFVVAVSYSVDAYAQTDSFRLMDYDANTDRVYVANSGQDEVWVINATAAPDTFQVLAKISVGTDPRDIAISDDGTKIYVTNHFDGTVSKITYDPITDEYDSTYIPLDVGNLPWGISLVSGKLFVANWGGSNIGGTDYDGTLTIYNFTGNPPRTDIPIGGNLDGGPWGLNSHPNDTWLVITDDGQEKLVLIHRVTMEMFEIDLSQIECYNPWDPVITDDGLIVTPCGDSYDITTMPNSIELESPLTVFAEPIVAGEPAFFPVFNLKNCWNLDYSFGGCTVGPPQKLQFEDEGATHNEPWAVYSQGDKIYGVDMYNKANPGEEQEEGTLLIWDATTLDLVSDGKIEYEDHPDKVGVGPRDVLVTPDGKIFVSNSGTHEISNKQNELGGTPFDYSSAVGASIIACDGSNCITSHPVTTTDNTLWFIIAGIVIAIVIIIFIVIRKQKKN
ncbi:hypothetical protein C5F50_01700 [Nitrosopumilus ureiphilus]|uniref:YncE family protein n=1 Tax=Nitrosopumilus ureiphilus TaxID=1470067 RepID=A0A7D5M494_9ARCH|nr:hypothetical protein C5F50_01700 [Nitrosopumilus ureiphilus]